MMSTGPLTGELLSILLLYKYAGLFLIECIASFGIPLPAGAALVAGGIFSGQGYFSLGAVIGWSLLGNVVGDIGLFYAARIWGREALRFFRVKKKEEPKPLRSFESGIVNYPFSSIFLSRFVASICPVVSAFAGLSPLPFVSYFIPMLAGEIFNTFVYVLIGYYFGSEWSYVSGLMVPIGLIVLVIFIAYIAIQARIKKRRNQGAK